MNQTRRKPMIVVGGGRVGRRAVKLLLERGFNRLTVVDPNSQALAGLPEAVETVAEGGVGWLVRSQPGNGWIVPALPVHLAYEWLRAVLGPRAVPAEVPEGLMERLPHAISVGGLGWAASWADFICPDDCDEHGICPVLGRRMSSLYGVLMEMATSYPMAVIRSHPLAPGLGGFSARSLARLRRMVLRQSGLFIVATACQCHGVFHALKIIKGDDDEA